MFVEAIYGAMLHKASPHLRRWDVSPSLVSGLLCRHLPLRSLVPACTDTLERLGRVERHQHEHRQGAVRAPSPPSPAWRHVW